jgi:CTP:molybdopterin cytidylyltransferase MocA
LIAAIILAAGKSERMGRPKALLKLSSQTFLERILDTVTACGIDRPIVVAGHHYNEIAEAFPSLSLTLNPDYERGMSTSVQAGIRALPSGVTAAGVFLVDHPLVGQDTVLALVKRLQPGQITLPLFGDRRGHPVFFGCELFPEILALLPDQGLNVVVRRDPARLVEVPVSSSSVLEDVDTPEDYQKLLRERK